MRPGKFDWEVWRGANASLPLTMQRNGAPDASLVTGSTFVLRIVSATGGELIRQEGAKNGAVVTFSLTPAQSMALPSGRVARYEIERRAGDVQEVWLYGSVNGLGGDND
jgi:hypothetical protein